MHFRTAVSAILALSLASAPVLAAPLTAPAAPTGHQLARPVSSQAITDSVRAALRQGEGVCTQLAAEYQADCLRQYFREARDEIRRRPDYAPAAEELRILDRQLDALVEQNIDRSAPVLSVQGKRVRAVKKAIAPQVNATARRAIAESATRLLRSAGSSQSVAHLTQIAQAVDSTKRILRS